MIRGMIVLLRNQLPAHRFRLVPIKICIWHHHAAATVQILDSRTELILSC